MYVLLRIFELKISNAFDSLLIFDNKWIS